MATSWDKMGMNVWVANKIILPTVLSATHHNACNVCLAIFLISLKLLKNQLIALFAKIHSLTATPAIP
jgi:hypothetical protein